MSRNADTTPRHDGQDAAELLAQVEAMVGCFPDGVLLYDSEGRIVRSNAAADAILGYTRQEQETPAAQRVAHGRYQWLTEDGGRVPLDDLPAMRAARYGETHRGFVVRMRGERVDRWLSVSAAPLIVRGQRSGAVVMLSDITDRKRAEQEVRSLAQFPKENPNPVMRTSTDGRVLFLNDAARALLRTMDWEEGAPLPEPLLREVERVPSRRTIQGHEVVTPDQRAWSFTLSASAGEGHVNVFGIDITERKRGLEALRESEARFRSIAENMSEGIMIFDANGDTIFQNPASLRIHGVGAGADGLFRRDELPVTWRGWDAEGRPLPFEAWPISRVLRNESFQDQVLHAERLETGHAFDASYNGCPIRDEQGRFVYGFITIRDITGQVRARKEQDRAEAALRDANERLREADRRKDEFLGMLSHELRNPLAPIRNSLYILDHAEAHGQQARRAKEVANRQIAHVTRLVDDLLDVTRIARGKIELRCSELDVAALARRTGEDHRALMQDRHLNLSIDTPDARVLVNGDETRLAQVLGNLLHNAAKFTPAGGRVTLAVAAEDGRAVIRVRDTGTRIEAETMPTIFEPFTQAKQTLARSEGGLGLGLALVKGLIALHGGDVAAFSAGPGAGTEFVVTVPLAQPRSASTGEHVVRRTAPAQRRRVLVIDDNKDAADSMAELVSMLGHTADVAYDAFAGLEKAAEEVPDVVLCDIGLPGMDGYEFARQFRAISSNHHVRLVAVSGYAQPEDVARAVEAGFDAHVAKPPDPERLADLLRTSA